MGDYKTYTDAVTVELLGDKQMRDLLLSLDTVISNKLVLAALNQGAQYINQNIQGRFMATKKNKSKTGYAATASLYKVQPIKNYFKTGVKLGISGKEGYKYRWANWGTAERSYIKRSGKEPPVKHETGKVSATNFFYGAVAASAPRANQIVGESIIKALKEMKQNADNQAKS